jgi:hypothetical protein
MHSTYVLGRAETGLRPVAGPRPPNRKKVHVGKILPPPWGLLGAAWRWAPSHQLVGALDPPAVTSVSAPNTRSLIFAHGGVGPGRRPVLGQVSPKRAGGQGGLGSSSSRLLAGLRSAAPVGYKKSPQKLGGIQRGIQSVEATAVPSLRCYCGALANHRAQVGCVAGRIAPPRSLRRCRVGGFAIWPFGDLAIGAHQLVRWCSFWCPAKLRSSFSFSPICDSQSTDRWQELVHQVPHVTAAPPRGGIWEQNCGLWQLDTTD